jgi:hypothetical protein
MGPGMLILGLQIGICYPKVNDIQKSRENDHDK